MNDIEILFHIKTVRAATAIDLMASVIHCKANESVVIFPIILYKLNENTVGANVRAKLAERIMILRTKLVHTRVVVTVINNDKVVLDFEGVNVVSNSFADECLAKLLLVMSFEELKRRTTFASVNDFARRNIAIAFRRRMAQV